MLHQYFKKFGELTDCVVIKNPTTKLSRCFGFVQFTNPQIADHVVESRPHHIDGKEIDVKHASAARHERHQQQMAAASTSGQDRVREPSPDKNKKRSRWEIQQSFDQQRHPLNLPHDMSIVKSNTHIAFVQRDFVTYPVPLKYLRENSFNSPTQDNSFGTTRHSQFNNRMYQS